VIGPVDPMQAGSKRRKDGAHQNDGHHCPLKNTAQHEIKVTTSWFPISIALEIGHSIRW